MAVEIGATPADQSDPRGGFFGMLAVLMTILLSIVSSAMIWRAATSANHWTLDIRLMWPVCAAAVAFSAFTMTWIPTLKRPAALLLASGLTTGAVVFVLDHFNLLVEYHEWLRRGMP